MKARGLVPALVLGTVLGTGAWGFDGEIDTQIRHNLDEVVLGPPGTQSQEIAADETLAQGTLADKVSLAPGLNLEGTLWASLDTLPSQTPLNLPPDKIAFTSRFLEGWANWEPVPGTLSVGAGKLVLHPSSGFSRTPLNFVDRGGATTGADATSAWEEGWVGGRASYFLDSLSFSVFGAPSLSWSGAVDQAGLKYLTSPQSDAFVQETVGFSLGTTDLRILGFQGKGNPRLGLGVDGGLGDAVTLRAEVAADASAATPKVDSMAGFTWAGSDKTTVMAELSYDDWKASGQTMGFLRWAGSFDKNLDSDVWTEVYFPDLSGWLGASLTFTGDKWSLSGQWQGSWGGSDTVAGSIPLRWMTNLEAKVFF